MLALKAPVEAVGKRTYAEALVGSGQTLSISTKQRVTFSNLDARDFIAQGASGRGASGVCSEHL